MRKRAEKPLPSKQQYTLLLETYARDAMKFLMLRQEEQYLATINQLAKACANLINYHNHPVEEVVKQLQTTMNQAYEANQQSVTERINQYKELRKSINVHTFHGKQENARLIANIDALQKYQKTPLADIILDVITDSFVKARQEHEAEIEQGEFLTSDFSPNIPPG
ncbi:hypothetical protein [Legionella brunensis]|uniref:Uncharacterized protein n=1 Tax=Legionella brunensis TaxID=29422 RepID=A0A0W0SUC1_9GAMM|nr:hypothetical protein [Legionella brunensis]KTC86876.1 hypothetical protein Lbru_0105 [Legionella brunensis]